MSGKSSATNEEPFGLQPVKTGVTQPHVLQWVDPTFDEAEPRLEVWLRRREIVLEDAA